MLGKLMKYELKACGRIFLPLYVAILLMSIIVGVSMNYEVFQIQGIAMIVLFGLFIALGVLTIMITIQRFRKNLLDDEGYLMFTLPVTSRALVFSKYSVSLLYAILSGIVSIFSFAIMLLIISKLTFGDFADVRYDLLGLFADIKPMKAMMLLFAIFSIVSYSIFILTLYLSVSMGQLPVFNKHRNLVAFISFFVINIVTSKIYELASGLFINLIDEKSLSIAIDGTTEFSEISYLINNTLSPYIVYNIIIYVIFAMIIFFGTTFILDKKLNLE